MHKLKNYADKKLNPPPQLRPLDYTTKQYFSNNPVIAYFVMYRRM